MNSFWISLLSVLALTLLIGIVAAITRSTELAGIFIALTFMVAAASLIAQSLPAEVVDDH